MDRHADHSNRSGISGAHLGNLAAPPPAETVATIVASIHDTAVGLEGRLKDALAQLRVLGDRLAGPESQSGALAHGLGVQTPQSSSLIERAKDASRELSQINHLVNDINGAIDRIARSL